jgi:hypothetical protein
MARPATGEIIERRGADRRVHRSLRSRVNGQRDRQPLGAVSLDQARQELENPLADVRPGPVEAATARAEAPTEPTVPTFHEFAEQWRTLSEGQWTENTRADAMSPSRPSYARSGRALIGPIWAKRRFGPGPSTGPQPKKGAFAGIRARSSVGERSLHTRLGANVREPASSAFIGGAGSRR